MKISHEESELMAIFVGFMTASLLLLSGLLALVAFRRSPSSKKPQPFLQPPFEVLHPPSKDGGLDGTEIDIIAVHSPNANETAELEWTWESNSEPRRVNWLKDSDMLHSIVPKARVMIYNCNSARTSFFNVSKTSLERCGEDFMRRLNSFRGPDPHRPIIFIGHSIGGLVVEHGLIFASRRRELRHLPENTVGCVFLGTPFRGSEVSGFLSKTAATFRSAITSALVHNVDSPDDVIHEFTYLARSTPIQVICFYELYKSSIGLFHGLVVSEMSATLPGLKRLGLLADHSNMNKFSNPSDSKFLKVSNEIRLMYENKSVELKKAKDTYPVQFMVPYGRNERFTGRKVVLEQLLMRIAPDSNYDSCQRTVLEGLGGVGKTQIAIEAAYRLRHKDPACSIYWVSAKTLASFENDYRGIARKLQISGCDDLEQDAMCLVMEALSQETRASKWLMIVDNVDDSDLLFHDSSIIKYLPFSRYGSILFTTRNHQIAVTLGAVTIKVDPMNLHEARELLRLTINPKLIEDENERSTEHLLQQLAYLPLAISHASAYMDRFQVTSTNYLNELQSNEDVMIHSLSQEFQTHGQRGFHQTPVEQTFNLSFHQLQKANHLATEYLQLSAFLHNKDIPFSFLPAAERHTSKIEAVGTLKAYTFIHERHDDSFDMHSLIQASVRSWVRDNGNWDTIVSKDVARMNEVLPIPNHRTRDPWSRHFPHVLSLLKFTNEAIGKNDPNLVELMSKTGTWLYKTGRYKQAGAVFQEGLAMQTRLLGSQHPSILLMQNHLAMALLRQGKFEDAVNLPREVVDKTQHQLGAEHQDSLESMNNLALVLEQQGKYQEAEVMNRRALAGREKGLGPDHPDTLTSLNNLALVLEQQGKYQEAEAMNRRALAGREKGLGPDHPDTLTSLNNLALVLQWRGKYEEAETMNRRALAGREKELGPDHPDTLTSLNNLALVLQWRGKYEEAETMNRRALAGREKELGPDHPDTLTSLNNLALMLQDQVKYEEAETMYQRALVGYEKVLGPDHASTLRTVNNLSRLYNGQGKLKEAKKMYERAQARYEKVLGPDHTSTLLTVNNLGELYTDQGKLKEAEKIY